MKQWYKERENPELKSNRLTAQGQKPVVSKKVTISAMLAWHEINKSILPELPNIELNIPEAQYIKEKING